MKGIVITILNIKTGACRAFSTPHFEVEEEVCASLEVGEVMFVNDIADGIESYEAAEEAEGAV